MFGGKDPKKIQEMMKKLNMKVREIDAEKVVIHGKDKDIVIENPQIRIADMMGKEVYQITGEVFEKSALSEDDIKIVMNKTGKDRETVVKKLEELNNDLAKAIMELKESKKNN